MNKNHTIARLSALIMTSILGVSAFAADPAVAPAKRTSKHSQAGAWLGAYVENQPNGLKQHARRHSADLRIDRVARHSPAERAGLKPGDAMRKFNNQRITSAHQLHKELRGLQPGATVPVEIFRDGKPQELTLTLAAPPSTHHAKRATARHHTAPSHQSEKQTG